jgi:hypothetical protein
MEGNRTKEDKIPRKMLSSRFNGIFNFEIGEIINITITSFNSKVE